MTDQKIPTPTPPKAPAPPKPGIQSPPPLPKAPAPPAAPAGKMPNPTMPPKPVSPKPPQAPAANPPKPAPAAPTQAPKPLNVPPPVKQPPVQPAPMPPAPKAPPVTAPPSGAPSMPAPTLPPSTPGILKTPPSAPKPPGAPAGAGNTPGVAAPVQQPPKSSIPPTMKAPGMPAQTPPAATQPGPTALQQPQQPAAPAGPTPKLASAPNPLFKFLPFILIAVVVLGLGWFLFSRLFGGGSRTPTGTQQTNGTTNTTGGRQVTLSYWGLWENDRVLQETLSEFEKQHPNIKVNYEQKSHKDYRERLQTAIASKKGPDVFRFHASWVPMMTADLSPVPTSVYSQADFQNTFYPIASQQLQVRNQYVGVPLMYEGLALLYNKDILRAANAQPPQTWADLKTLANQLTVRSGNRVERAGLAIGNASNVEHFSDILGLMIYQNGGNPATPNTKEVQEAMSYYLSFVNNAESTVWDPTLPSSSVAFARGEVAMIFAPSWRVHEIRAQNPNLSFGVAPVPQLGGNKVTWASYWAEGVNAQSKYKDEAWQLIQFLSSKEAMQKFYSSASKERSFGELYSRTDLANELAQDTYAAAYLSDAPTAQSWYLNSFTHDNGINDQIIKYYEDALNTLSGSSREDEAFSTLEKGVSQVLKQYNVPVTAQ